MKKAYQFVVLMLMLTGCALPGQAVPTALPTSTVTNTITPTITIKVTSTFTTTPTSLGGGRLISETETLTPTVTPIPQGFNVPTPNFASYGFNNIFLSDHKVFWGKCQPNQVTFTIQVGKPALTKAVQLSVRLKGRKRDDVSDWNSLPMNKNSAGSFSYTLKTESMRYHDILVESWIQYQLVSLDEKLKEITRTPVIENDIMLDPCPPQ